MVCPVCVLLVYVNNFTPCGPMYLLLFIPERETGLTGSCTAGECVYHLSVASINGGLCITFLRHPYSNGLAAEAALVQERTLQ